MKKGLSQSVSFTFFKIPQPPKKRAPLKLFSFSFHLFTPLLLLLKYYFSKMLPIYNLLITFNKPFLSYNPN